MKLIITEDGIRLEMGYELGFGPPCFNYLVDIIHAFMSDDMTVLYPFIERDKELWKEKDWQKENLLDSFHYDLLFDENGSQTNKIKEILYDHYSQLETIVDSEEIKDILLTEFRKSKLEENDVSLKDKIKDYLYSVNVNGTLDDRDLFTQEFIKKRVKYYNQEWLFDCEVPIDLIGVYWVEIVDREDTLKWFEIYDWWFNCVIGNQSARLSEYQYFLDYTEEHGEEFDGMVLRIFEKTKGQFLIDVMPKLQKLFTALEIVDQST